MRSAMRDPRCGINFGFWILRFIWNLAFEFWNLRILRVLFLLYVLVILMVSVLPINGPESPINDIYVIDIRLDYLLHALIFIPFVPLAVLSVVFSSPTLRNTLLIILSGLLLAIVAESIQYLLPYRTFNINDLIANTIGITLGIPSFILFKLNTKT